MPCELFSDNGPQFSSSEFANFAEEWGFKHSTSSPTYPKSNGLAECSVKTMKNMMKKAVDKGEFQKSLLIYRSTPLENGLSPAQMLMGRRIRSNLPVDGALLTPRGAHRVKQTKQQLKVKQKWLHDRTAKHLPMLKPGDSVRLRDVISGTWRQRGEVQKEVAPRSYRIQLENGLALRRNRVDLQLQPAETQDTERSMESTSSSIDDAGSGPTVSSSSAAERPKRLVRPPKRLIETC